MWKNENKEYRAIKVLDIKIVKQVIEYRYYPNEDGTFNIPENHNRAIQYGSNLKTSCILTYKKNGVNVMDAIKSAFDGIPVKI